MASVYGAHLRKQATEDVHGPTADAVPSTVFSFSLPRGSGVIQPSEPDPTKLDAAKKALRAAAAERRAALDAGLRAAAARAVARHVLDSVPLAPGAVVSGYWPMGDELDLRPLLAELDARGHPCCLPVVVGRARPLVFRAWRPGAPLEAAAFGTRVPPADAPERVPAVLLVPLLAFDDAGYRIGYGGGFYDRTLARLRAADPATCAVGVAFAAQRVAAVPRGETDERLDWIVTEEGARMIP